MDQTRTHWKHLICITFEKNWKFRICWTDSMRTRFAAKVQHAVCKSALYDSLSQMQAILNRLEVGGRREVLTKDQKKISLCNLYAICGVHTSVLAQMCHFAQGENTNERYPRAIEVARGYLSFVWVAKLLFKFWVYFESDVEMKKRLSVLWNLEATHPAGQCVYLQIFRVKLCLAVQFPAETVETLPAYTRGRKCAGWTNLCCVAM